jgi:endonuclease-8
MLMDQKIVAGIGNVYRAELLFLAGVWPWLPSKALPRDRFDQIWDDAVRLLSLGVRINRIVTVPPEVTGTAPSKTPRAKAVYVYKRRVCQVCGSEITWGEMANRKVYACPTCQPLGRDR